MLKIILVIRISSQFDERFKITSVPIFIPDFDLSNSELDILLLKHHFESFHNDIILKRNKIIILSWFLVKNLK